MNHGDHSTDDCSNAFCFYHWQITSSCSVFPVNTQKSVITFYLQKCLYLPMIDLRRQGNKSFLYDRWGDMKQMTMILGYLTTLFLECSWQMIIICNKSWQLQTQSFKFVECIALWWFHKKPNHVTKLYLTLNKRKTDTIKLWADYLADLFSRR
jgi:hypothetical protein